jgi:hypothetical protein
LRSVRAKPPYLGDLASHRHDEVSSPPIGTTHRSRTPRF